MAIYHPVTVYKKMWKPHQPKRNVDRVPIETNRVFHIYVGLPWSNHEKLGFHRFGIELSRSRILDDILGFTLW
jgi:hypothetical protein